MSFKDVFLQLFDVEVWKKFQKIAHDIESQIDHIFTAREYLYTALAIPASNLPSEEFQRQEYLGDSILQAVIGLALYESYEEFDPGRLTKVRASLVENKNLSLQAHDLGLTEVSRILGVGRLSEKQSADLFEAFVGALFLDSGKNFDETKALVKKFLNVREAAEAIESSPWGDQDPKSYLTQHVQKEYKNDAKVVFIHEAVGESSRPMFEAKIIIRRVADEESLYEATGDPAPNKKEAEKRAAEKLLLQWKDENKNE